MSDRPNDTDDLSTASPESEPTGVVRDQSRAADDHHAAASKARSAFLWLFSTTLIWQVASWGLTLLTARVLSPRDYGLLGLSEAIFPYLLMITTLKMEQWLLQVDDFSERAQEAVLSFVLLLSLATFALAMLAAPGLAWFYNEPEVILPFQVSALIFFFRALQLLPEARLRRELNFKPLAVSNLTLGVARGVIQLLLARAGFGYWALVLGGLFKEIAAVIWYVAIAGTPTRLRWDSKLCSKATTFGLAATGSTIFWVVFMTADNIVVGKLFGTEILGYYAMAFFLTELPISKINGVLGPVLAPYFGRVKQDISVVRSAYLKVTRGFFLVLAPVLVGMSLTAPEAIEVLLGPKWFPMTDAFRVLAIAALLRTLATNTSPLLFALNRPQLVLKGTMIPAVVLPLCFYFLGRECGLPGIFVTWLFIYPIAGLWPLLGFIRDVTGVTPLEYIRNLMGPLTAVLCMAAAVFGVGFLPMPAMPAVGAAAMLLTVKALAGALVFGAVLRLSFWKEVKELLRGPVAS